MARNWVGWCVSIVPRVDGPYLVNHPGFRFAVMGLSPDTPFKQRVMQQVRRAITLFRVKNLRCLKGRRRCIIDTSKRFLGAFYREASYARA